MKARKCIALLLALAAILSLFAGCGQEKVTEVDPGQQTNQQQNDNSVVPQAKYAWKAKYLKLTTNDATNFDYIDGFCVSGNSVYYTGSYEFGQIPYTDDNGEAILDENGEPTYYSEYLEGVFRMDLSTGEISNLSGYTKPVIGEGLEGNSYIQTVVAGADGTVWLLETVYTYTFDLPENFDEATDSEWDYYTGETRTTLLTQYDSQGQKLNTVTIDLGEDFYSSSTLVDENGNIFLCDWQSIYALDADGNQLFSATPDNGMNGMVQLNGEVGVITWNNEGMVFLPVDLEAKAFGKEVSLKNNAYNLYSGNEEYTYLYRDNDSIYGYQEQTDTAEKYLSWLDCDVDGNNIDDLAFLPDGRIAALERVWSNVGYSESNLILLEQVEASSLPQKQELTLACVGLSSQMRSLIVQFNRSHDDIRVVVDDYSDLYEDGATYDDVLQKLNTQILSGDAPDLISLSGLSVEQYAAKGVLMDIWPLIDSDEELSRDDLMTHLFDCMSIDGKLYQITNSFSIQSAAVRTDIAGDRTSWTLEEMMQALEQLEDGATVFSDTVTKGDMLSSCLSFNLSNFVDWATGQCSFDSQQFKDILNFVNTFPESYDWESYDWETEESEYSRLQNHKQLMTSVYLSDFQELQVQPALHGGDITYIGYPSAEGTGSCFQLGTTLAISATCADPEAAWTFARELLLAENQTDIWYFPSNKAAFDAAAKEAMKAEYMTDPETGEQVEVSNMGIGYGNDFEIDIYATTQEQYDALMELYERVQSVYSYDTSLMDIITEECAAFFAGQKTVEETANLIQNRVSLYVAERM